jgi:hypothetical protein
MLTLMPKLVLSKDDHLPCSYVKEERECFFPEREGLRGPQIVMAFLYI